MNPILKVDLSSGKYSQLEFPPNWREQYLGGASLAARLLYDQLTPELHPLSSEAPLLFICGPLTGTSGPAVGRFVVCGRSPATSLWAESNCGGFWGPELRKAGYDGLWLQGQASEPVYLWIHDGEADLRPASHLWGLDAYQTQTTIKEELADKSVRVACIGLAGERQIPCALIMCDHGRVAGRTGMGAVMGSKNLKAIAVQGEGKIRVADPETYNRLRSQANRDLRDDNMARGLRELGTASTADYFDYLGEMPKRYFQRGAQHAELKVSGSYVKETILSGVSTCHACVIACGRVVRLSDGEERKGAEYETLIGFGPNLGLNDPILANHLGEMCDRFGLDTISISNTIGLAYRLFELGLITTTDTGGLNLVWGDGKPVETLIQQTAHRDGFGAHLAEGARALGRQFGAEEEAVQVNGLEVAYHDPRGASGMALVYTTSPRGACHNQSDYFVVDIGKSEEELGIQYFDRKAGEEKAANVAIHQDWRTLLNSLVMCFFANLSAGTTRDLINAACGLEWDIEEMMQAGERAWNLKRLINHRLGLTRQNDSLPNALLMPYSDRQPDDFVPDLDAMLEAYYQARGWDAETGYPQPELLRRLGLDWVVKDLYGSIKET